MVEKQNINRICIALSWSVRVCGGLLAVMHMIFGQIDHLKLFWWPLLLLCAHITFIYDSANEDFDYFKWLGWGYLLVFHKMSAKCLRVYPSYRT